MPHQLPYVASIDGKSGKVELTGDYVGTEKIGAPGGIAPLDSTGVLLPTALGRPRLHTDQKAYVRFAMYWPRKSKYPDWWREMEKGTITWADVAADLDQMKAALGINAVRVFTYYDHVYRETAGQSRGWTDGNGHHNNTYRGWLSTFIDMCAERDLDVIVTTFQKLKALKSTDDWSFLETDIEHYKSFLGWLLTMLKDKPNVHFYNLMNEPDGYGVWADAALAMRVLKFLSILKDHGKQVAPRLLTVISGTTHDNNFRRLPVPPPGAASMYELTDILALNTFLWGDTGFWSGQNYRSQSDYVHAQNVLGKPIVQTECGWPVGYAQQGVAGSPKVDEAGNATGGTYAETEDSIVPEGGIFDRPKGVVTGVPHTEANQARAVGEAAYWAWRQNFEGLGLWSAFDHANPALSYVYRDPFGVIDKDGAEREAAGVFAAALSERYDKRGEWHISLAQGTVSGLPSRINGLGGFNTTDRAQNTIGGVYLHNGGGSWTSDNLLIGIPLKVRLRFTVRVANTHAEPFIFRLLAGSRTLDWRYKVYDKSAFQAIDATATGDVPGGWSQTMPFGVGEHEIILDLTSGVTPAITYDGTPLTFTTGTPLVLRTYETTPLRLMVLNYGNSPVDLTRLTALGPAGGLLPLVPRKKPTR